MKKPKVSIVIPCYNHKNFIKRTLSSIARQTYSNIEVVLIDDGSKDSSFAEVQKFAKKNTKIKWILKERDNKGSVITINEGIRLSSGEIITILNSDDTFEPGRISALIQPILERKTDLTLSAVTFIDDYDNPIPKGAPQNILYERAVSEIPFDTTFSFSCYKFPIQITSGNLVFSRGLWNKLKQFNNYEWCHDYDFLLRACLETEPVFIAEPLLNYRIHSNNTFNSIENRPHQFNQELRDVLSAYIIKGAQKIIQNKPINPNAPTIFTHPDIFPIVFCFQNFVYSEYEKYADSSCIFDRSFFSETKQAAKLHPLFSECSLYMNQEKFSLLFVKYRTYLGLNSSYFQFLGKPPEFKITKTKILPARTSAGNPLGTLVIVEGTNSKSQLLACFTNGLFAGVLEKDKGDPNSFVGLVALKVSEKEFKTWVFREAKQVGTGLEISGSPIPSRELKSRATPNESRGHIDQMFLNQNDQIVVRGWMLIDGHLPKKLNLKINGKKIDFNFKFEPRDDLNPYLKFANHWEFSGFQLLVDQNKLRPRKAHEIEVTTDSKVFKINKKLSLTQRIAK